MQHTGHCSDVVDEYIQVSEEKMEEAAQALMGKKTDEVNIETGERPQQDRQAVAEKRSNDSSEGQRKKKKQRFSFHFSFGSDESD